MSVRRRLATTAIAAAIGVGFTTMPAAAALATPAPAGRPASAAQQAKPTPAHPTATLAPLTMTQAIADLLEALNNHPQAVTPLLNVEAGRLFGSFGYVTAVNPTNHTITVSQQIGFPGRSHTVVTIEAGSATVLRNNTAATLADVRIADRIGVGGSRQGSRHTALTVIVHGPA